ncbi:MAG: winged helix-turn-helix domain-containing protein, partial [Nitrososphaerales archaeon]
KTRIMQVGYLNFYQVTKYLDYLMSAGLLESISKPYPGFRTTEKGRMFLALLTVTDYKVGQADREMAGNPKSGSDSSSLQLSQIEKVLLEVFKEDAVALLMEKIRSVAQK